MSPYQHGEVLRHRGRRRNRPRPRTLRALYRRGPEQIFKPHHGQGLLERAQQGAPRRIPRRDRSGDTPYHKRDQGLHIQGRQTRQTRTLLSRRSAERWAISRASRSLKRYVRYRLRSDSENCLFIHVTLVPYLHGSEEHKSKPTQHSVKELQGMGISPGYNRSAMRRAARGIDLQERFRFSAT